MALKFEIGEMEDGVCVLLDWDATEDLHDFIAGALEDRRVVLQKQIGTHKEPTVEPKIRITPGVGTMYRVWVQDLVCFETDDAFEAIAYMNKVGDNS